MTTPQLPPRSFNDRQDSLPPPLPPLPPDFRVPDRQYNYESAPHYESPLAAPRPHRVDPDIPANMARTLDDQANSYLDRRLATPVPPPNFTTPGFTQPNALPVRGASPLPPPQGAGWIPWNPSTGAPPGAYTAPAAAGYSSPPPMPQPQTLSPQVHPSGLSPAMAAMFFNQQQPPHRREPSVYNAPPPNAPATQTKPNVPSLTAPLPTIPTLAAAIPAIQQPNHNPNLKIAWCRDVIFLVDRSQQNNASTDTPIGPVRISDPELQRMAQLAVSVVVQLASPQQMPNPVPAYVAEAIYLKATFAASGGYPDQVPHSLRSAFRDFEQSARGGYAAAWFRLGRDYESFNDVGHARDCFERGVKLGVESCTYRMGMAHLMGQLGLPPQPDLAVPLLHRAATLATLDVPQPAYVYGLLLLNEFSQVTIPPQLFTPFIPNDSTPQQEARKHLERAAYLNFAPAQYKLGHAYEFAQPPFPFDALLSVQYYSLASQQGETEADMALSKWFLCGAEGAFEKDEALAFTFAEKAARKGLPSAEFAMGYYAEVGVGGPKDVGGAMQWYRKAAEHGNTDASDRLSALSQPAPQALSRQEHDAITENKLVRKRTQAKQRSEQHANSLPPPGPRDGGQIVAMVRKNSLAQRPGQGVNDPHRQRMGTMPEQGPPGDPGNNFSQSATPRPRPQGRPYP